jgi:hypothetical protein
MNKRSIGYALFGVLVFITVAGQGGLAPRGVKPPRGVGCSGSAGVAPRLPAGGLKVAPTLAKVPKVALKPATVPKVPTKLILPVHPDAHAPLPARLSGQHDVLRAHAATRDWELFIQECSIRPVGLPAVVGHHLEALELGASDLKALSRLRNLVHGPWPQDVSAEEVVVGLAAFNKTASLQDAAGVRRYIALRAKMEGQPGVARRLLQPGETLEERSVLRDLQRLEEINATPPPTSPLGDVPLPEPVPLGLKAPVREALDKDLPVLVAELPGAELRARRGVLRAIETSAANHWYRVAIHLHNLKSSASASEPDDRENEVELQLGRPLSPEERLLARRLLRTRRPAEVADALRPLVRK